MNRFINPIVKFEGWHVFVLLTHKTIAQDSALTRCMLMTMMMIYY